MSEGAAVTLEDPLRFVLEALEVEGALVDRADERATVLLPQPLAARLSLAEETQLAIYPERKDEVAAGLGSPLLEKLVGEARASVPVASVRAAMESPRPAQVRSMAERFALRNGLAETVQVTIGTGLYLVASVAYVIEADDRHEGMVTVVTSSDGGEPDAELSTVLAAASADPRVMPARAAVPAEAAARWTAIRAAHAVRLASAPLLREVERRQARDRDRIAEYFGQLGAEARAPRRRTDPAAIEAKLAHLTAERNKKIEDLRTRYAARVTASVAVLVAAEVPCALLQLRLRRRKAERALTLRLPAGARAADKPACEGCGMPAAKPAACDDALHLLCEACAPSAQGRIACPACRGG